MILSVEQKIDSDNDVLFEYTLSHFKMNYNVFTLTTRKTLKFTHFLKLITGVWAYKLRKIDCEQSPFFLLSSSSRGKTSRTAAARKPRQGIFFSCFSMPRFLRASVRDGIPRLDELKRKNRDCSQSMKNKN